MNFINLPVFILFLAFVYLLSVYGLLKMAEIQKQGDNFLSNNQKATEVAARK